MYENNANQAFDADALQHKLRAEAAYRQEGGGVSMGGLQRAIQKRESPLMEQSAEEAHKAVAELDAQVSELLARIAPVCQPAGALASGSVGGKEAPETTPSPIRGEFMKLRYRVQEISSRIASVRYTIEI